MSNIRIKKIKRKSNGTIFIGYEIPSPQADGEFDEFTMSCKQEPHIDFVTALSDLAPSVKEILELPDEYAQGLVVSGVSFTHKETEAGEVEGCVITAQKALKGHPAPAIFNTPHKTEVPYSETGDDSATLTQTAIVALEALKAEAEAYIGGKRGEPKPVEPKKGKKDKTEVAETTGNDEEA